MLQDSDPSLRELAREELSSAEQALEKLEHELQILLLPKDPHDDNNIFLEIRAGTGGDEAAILRVIYLECIHVTQNKKGGKPRFLALTKASTGATEKLSLVLLAKAPIQN